jgi:hypothetical protein
MVLSLLAAFSAPMAVKVLPSCLASSAETAAKALLVASAAIAVAIRVWRNMMVILASVFVS